MTAACRNDHMRSPMIASAMTEHRISGQIGHPAASMMDNTYRSEKVGLTLVGARSVSASKAQVTRHQNEAKCFTLLNIFRFPHCLWITSVSNLSETQA